MPAGFDYRATLAALRQIGHDIIRGATEVLLTVGESTALDASSRVNRRSASRSMKDAIRFVPTGQTRGFVTAGKDYSAFVEYGRGPVTAKNAKALRFVINGEVIFRKSVKAAAPRPFMTPAWERAEIVAEQSANAMVLSVLQRRSAL